LLEENSVIFFAPVKKKFKGRKRCLEIKNPLLAFFHHLLEISVISAIFWFCGQRESGLEIQKPSACSFHQMCFGLHRAQIFFGLLFPKTFLGQK
jgi:hypothetical protein